MIGARHFKLPKLPDFRKEKHLDQSEKGTDAPRASMPSLSISNLRERYQLKYGL